MPCHALAILTGATRSTTTIRYRSYMPTFAGEVTFPTSGRGDFDDSVSGLRDLAGEDVVGGMEWRGGYYVLVLSFATS